MRELSLVQEGYHLLIFRPFHTLSCTIADRQINPGVPLEGFQLNKEVLKSFEGLPQQHQRSTDEIWSARTKKKKGHQRIQESENTSPSKEICWSCRFTLSAKSLQTVFKKTHRATWPMSSAVSAIRSTKDRSWHCTYIHLSFQKVRFNRKKKTKKTNPKL